MKKHRLMIIKMVWENCTMKFKIKLENTNLAAWKYKLANNLLRCVKFMTFDAFLLRFISPVQTWPICMITKRGCFQRITCWESSDNQPVICLTIYRKNIGMLSASVSAFRHVGGFTFHAFASCQKGKPWLMLFAETVIIAMFWVK